MQREDRYLVFKYNDTDKYLDDFETDQLRELATKVRRGRWDDDKDTLKCVVVESDWPEYEQTWKAIEARVDSEKAPNTRI